MAFEFITTVLWPVPPRSLNRGATSPTNGRTLIALFVIAPADYTAHHRGARRIGFDKLDIPFVVYTHEGKRTQLGAKVLGLRLSRQTISEWRLVFSTIATSCRLAG